MTTETILNNENLNEFDYLKSELSDLKNELTSNNGRLEEKTELTDEEVKKITKNAAEHNQILKLNKLKKITDKQSVEFSKVRGLQADSLEKITDEQALNLWKTKFLFMNSLSTITDKQAEALWKPIMLWLNGLKKLTDKQKYLICILIGIPMLIDIIYSLIIK